MEIKSAEFVISNTDVSKCPQHSMPEYAFIGRSNVGKSSLINMLTNRKGLAMTSATPGKTLLINHFLINTYPHHQRLHPGAPPIDIALCPHRQPPRAPEDRPGVHRMAR